jgi:hypothetical protein
MLQINVGETKNLVVTLYEESNNLVNPYFTWVLSNRDTFEETIFYQDDSSNNPYYYNSFTVSCATYSGLTQGIIDLRPGEYHYNIYEKDVPYSLTYSLTDNLVENGILIVTGTYSEMATFTYSYTDIPTFKIT